MTEEATETDTEAPPPDEADWLKQLRKDAAEAKTLRTENATLKRQGAMDELGIPKTGSGKLFREKWDGDPTDLDALAAAAREYELIPAEGDQPAPAEVDAALDSASGMADLAAAGAAQPTATALLGEAGSIDEIERIAADAGIGVPIR